jgi:molybdopterin-guanine dinucleotide biosynthesis adapter protein
MLSKAMRVIGLAGWSGAGKTTLLLRLIPELAQRGVAVSTVKHAHHAFEVDETGPPVRKRCWSPPSGAGP